MSHNEFPLAWTRLLQGQKMHEHRNTGEGASLSSMSTGSTGSSRRARISESALNPMDGSLKCRLNCSILHLPVKPKMNKKQSYCQLHYWCNNERKYSNTAFCSNCNVLLCVDRCYEIFHTEYDLHKMKSETKKKMKWLKYFTLRIDYNVIRSL